MKFVFALSIFILVEISNIKFVSAFDSKGIQQFLNERESLWPNWTLPSSNFSDIHKDLIYPDWFEGNWIVNSEAMDDQNQPNVTYKVNFIKNEAGEIIGNRSKNAESIGKAIFGGNLKRIKNDPKSFNNQVTYFANDEYLESRVTLRKQVFDTDQFWADEFAIQTFHKPDASRINQVEVMSKFYQCKQDRVNFQEKNESNICGYQYVASFGSKVGNKNQNAISSKKYKLTFKPIQD